MTVDFDALQAAGATTDADTVQAHWTAMQVTPRRPRFMDEGDCELVDDLRAVLKDGFSWRGLDYSANCVPHDLTLGASTCAARCSSRSSRRACALSAHGRAVAGRRPLCGARALRVRAHGPGVGAGPCA